MDEEKRKYLDELKKQIDPEVLSKMAKHLGGNEGAALHAQNAHQSVEPSGIVTSDISESSSDSMRDRKAREFMNRVARRKREEQMQDFMKKEEDVIPRKLLVLSKSAIWSRIVESQFKTMGFNEAESLKDFQSLIRRIFEIDDKKEKIILALAISLGGISSFLQSWNKLLEEMKNQNIKNELDHVEYFVVIESRKQVTDTVAGIFGNNKIIELTDDVENNKEKINLVLAPHEKRLRQLDNQDKR